MPKTAKTTKEHISIPKNSWVPLPSELSLRGYILDITRGAWKKRTFDPVAWQRAFRTQDKKRLEKIHKMMGGLKKK